MLLFDNCPTKYRIFNIQTWSWPLVPQWEWLLTRIETFFAHMPDLGLRELLAKAHIDFIFYHLVEFVIVLLLARPLLLATFQRLSLTHSELHFHFDVDEVVAEFGMLLKGALSCWCLALCSRIILEHNIMYHVLVLLLRFDRNKVGIVCHVKLVRELSAVNTLL